MFVEQRRDRVHGGLDVGYRSIEEVPVDTTHKVIDLAPAVKTAWNFGHRRSVGRLTRRAYRRQMPTVCM
jgi:hypothetical protein